MWRQKSYCKTLQPASGVGEVERQPGRIVGPRTPTVQGTAVVCNIQERQLEHNWYLHMYVYTNKQLCRLAAYKHRRHAHYLLSMFSCCINLVSPSLARCQVNTMELATNCFSLLMLTWLKSISAIDVVYDGEIVQRVAPQKLTAHLAYRYTYIDRS